MDDVERHYGYIVYIMKFVGVWPYTLNFRVVLFVIVNFLTLLYIIVQLGVLKTDIDLDTTIILRILAFTMVTFSTVVKYDFFWLHMSTVRYLMDIVKNTWNTANVEERELLEKHTKIGKRRTELFSLIIFPGAVLTVIIRIQTYIAVVTAPPGTNFSDPFPLLTNYFVSEETMSEFFLLTVIHQSLAILLIALVPLSTELMYIMWLEHGTALFLISSYHLEKGFAGKPPAASTEEIKNYRYDCFVSAIKFDVLGYHFVEVIRDKFRFLYAFQILLAVISLASNIFRISTALRVTHNTEELYLATSLTSIQLFYMYYTTSLMQSTGELAANLPTVAYNQPWYDRSIVDQKSILLIILLRANKTILFDYYGFYSCTRESFTVLMKLCGSYLMMMLQFQEADELGNKE